MQAPGRGAAIRPTCGSLTVSPLGQHAWKRLQSATRRGVVVFVTERATRGQLEELGLGRAEYEQLYTPVQSAPVELGEGWSTRVNPLFQTATSASGGGCSAQPSSRVAALDIPVRDLAVAFEQLLVASTPPAQASPQADPSFADQQRVLEAAQQLAQGCASDEAEAGGVMAEVADDVKLLQGLKRFVNAHTRWNGETGKFYEACYAHQYSVFTDLKSKSRTPGNLDMGNVFEQLKQQCIEPMSLGASAHDAVVAGLRKDRESAALGRFVSPLARYIPFLHKLRGPMVPEPVELAPGLSSTPQRDDRLVMDTTMSWMVETTPEGRVAAMAGLPELPDRVEAFRRLVRQEVASPLQQAVLEHCERALEQVRAAATAPVPAAAAEHLLTEEMVKGGWSLIQGRWFHNGNEVSVAEMPLMAYWATMRRYFSPVVMQDLVELRKEKKRPGERLMIWAARLQKLVDDINNASDGTATSLVVSDMEAVEILFSGLSADAECMAVLEQQRPLLNTIVGADRNVMGMARRLQEAYDTELASLQMRASLASNQVLRISAPAAGAHAKEEQVLAVPTHHGRRDAQQFARKLAKQLTPSELAHYAEAFAAQEQGAGGRGALVHEPRPVAAAAAQLGQDLQDIRQQLAAVPQAIAAAVGGLKQHILQRQQNGPSGRGRPWPCVCPGRPVHQADQVCWAANPSLAPQYYRGPPESAGKELQQAYRAAVKRDVAAGLMKEPSWLGNASKGQPAADKYPTFACRVLGSPECCVPVQDGWTYDSRPAAAGTSWMAAAVKAGQVAADAAAAGAQRPRRVPGAGLDAAVSNGLPAEAVQGSGMRVMFSLSYPRDKDILDSVVEGEPRYAGAAAAAAMQGFEPLSLQRQQLQQGMLWASRGTCVWLTAPYPQCRALIDQVAARDRLVDEAVQQQRAGQQSTAAAMSTGLGRVELRPSGGDVVSTALSEESPLAGRLAAMPADQRQQFLQWQEHEGGLVYFANPSKAAGLTLVLPDGREHVSQLALLDSGCETALIDAACAKGAGMHVEQLPAVVTVVTVDGRQRPITHHVRGVQVVLAAGTAQEVSVKLNFLVVDGLRPLADYIIPTAADHHWGGVGVDRLTRVYTYRPYLASMGDVQQSSVPVRCWRPRVEAGAAAAAPLAAAMGRSAPVKYRISSGGTTGMPPPFKFPPVKEEKDGVSLDDDEEEEYQDGGSQGGDSQEEADACESDGCPGSEGAEAASKPALGRGLAARLGAGAEQRAPLVPPAGGAGVEQGAPPGLPAGGARVEHRVPLVPPVGRAGVGPQGPSQGPQAGLVSSEPPGATHESPAGRVPRRRSHAAAQRKVRQRMAAEAASAAARAAQEHAAVAHPERDLLAVAAADLRHQLSRRATLDRPGGGGRAAPFSPYVAMDELGEQLAAAQRDCGDLLGHVRALEHELDDARRQLSEANKAHALEVQRLRRERDASQQSLASLRQQLQQVQGLAEQLAGAAGLVAPEEPAVQSARRLPVAARWREASPESLAVLPVDEGQRRQRDGKRPRLCSAVQSPVRRVARAVAVASLGVVGGMMSRLVPGQGRRVRQQQQSAVVQQQPAGLLLRV